MDYIPVPVCKIAREKRCQFRNNSFETKPDKGYSAISYSPYVKIKFKHTL